MALTTRVNGTLVGGSPNNAQASWWNDYQDLLTGAMHDQSVNLNFRPGSGTVPTLRLQGDGHGPLLQGLDTNGTSVVATLDHAGNLTITGNKAVGGTLTVTGATALNAKETLTPVVSSGVAATYDALVIIPGAGSLYGVNLGYGDTAFPSGEGLYAFDVHNTGFIFSKATKNAITFGGTINAITANIGPASVPGATTSYVLAKLTGDTATRASLGIRSDGSGDLRLSNNGTAYQVELYTDGGNFRTTAGIIVGGNVQLNGGKNAFYADNGLTGKFDAQTTAPSSPATGDLWLDTSTVL